MKAMLESTFDPDSKSSAIAKIDAVFDGRPSSSTTK